MIRWCLVLCGPSLLVGCSLMGLDDMALPRCATNEDCAVFDDDLPEGSCQQHFCGVASGRCVLGVRDVDGDGEPPVACGGLDCDDTDPDVNPSAPEVCGNDIDEDCDGAPNDLDCDEVYSIEQGGLDCDDLDRRIGPNAVEVCGNDVDEDCDGAANDLDCDGVVSIEQGGLDCDDRDPARNPLRREACNGVDDDCNGMLDGPGEDDDLDGYADECAGEASTDCDDLDARTHVGAEEVCDGLDNDCIIDGVRRLGGGARAELSEDADGDRHSSPNADCYEVADDGTPFFPRDDCDDANAGVHPGAFESCDGLDNDCDGVPDNVPGSTEAGGACLVIPEVSAGAGHTCVLQRDGTVVCWGVNDHGQLGLETTAPYDAILVPGLEGVVQISAGMNGTCGLHTDGSVGCWGLRALTRRGRVSGSGIGRVDVTGATQVATGAEYACAIVGDAGFGGVVSCWGLSVEAELDGVTRDTVDATGLYPGHLPAPVPGIADAVQVAAGDGVSCAVRATGEVFCWGDNGEGQLGNGETSGPARATVAGLDASQVACGDHFACALDTTGSVWCWGRRLGGAGVGDDLLTPEAVPDLTDVAELGAGTGGFACALDTSGGVWCWGANTSGQLGDVTVPSSTTPLLVSGVDDAVHLSVGADHACATRADGTVACWGGNTTYQLGLGHNRLSPGLVVEPTVIANAMQIVGTCFRLPDLSVRCGDGSIDLPAGSATDVAMSASSWCAVELSGEVRCEGDDFYGQLGVGDTDRETVIGLPDAVDVACGDTHCCAVRHTGRVVCWGDNEWGQLGVEEVSPTLCFDVPCSTVPLRVDGLSDAARVVAGRAHSCALTADGRVVCWGDNDEGQVGAPTPGVVAFASEVVGLPPDDPAVDVAAAGDTSCAVLRSGAVFCWGARLSPLLDGGSDPRPLPDVHNAMQVALSSVGLCARLGSGAVQCVGFEGIALSVAGVWDARDIGCADSYCCLTRTSGQSMCWGLVPAGLVAPVATPTAAPLPVVDLF